MDLYWKTHAWLSKPKRQDHELWPVVLDLWCRTYIDLLTSVVQIASLTNERDEELWEACAPEEQKKEVKASYGRLWSAGKARLYQFEGANRLMLEKLAGIRPAAQNRGMFWHIGFTHETGGLVHPVYAKDVIRQGGDTYRLTDDTSRISAAKDNASERQPTYHVVAVAANGDTTYGTMVAPYKSAKWERLSSLLPYLPLGPRSTFIPNWTAMLTGPRMPRLIGSIWEPEPWRLTNLPGSLGKRAESISCPFSAGRSSRV